MASIPEYKSRQPLNQPADTSLRSQAQLTQEIGQGVAGLLGRGADMVFEARMAEEKIKKETYLNQAQADMRGSLLSLERHIEKEYSQNPDKGVEVWRARYKEITDGMAKAAPFQSAKREFGFFSQNVGQKAEERILSWKDKQIEANYIFSQDNLANNMMTEIYRNPRDKQIYEETMMGLSDLANAFSVTQNPFLVNEKNRAYRKAAVQARFKALFDEAGRAARTGDIAGANKIMDEVKGLIDSKDFDYDLGADGVSQITGNIKKFREQAKRVGRDFDSLKLRNPYEYLRKTGQGVPPVDLSVPETVLARAEMRPSLEARNNVVLPLLSPLEKVNWQRQFDRAEPAQQEQMLSSINQYPTDIAKELATTLFPDRPEYAAAIRGMQVGSAGGYESARKIIDGSDFLRKNKDSKLMANVLPKQKAVSMHFDKLVGPSIRDAYSRTAALNAGMAALAEDRRSSGRTGEALTAKDKKAFDKAVFDLGLVPYKYNNQFIRRPRDPRTKEFVDDSRMSTLVRGINEDVLVETHGSGTYNRAGNPFDLGAAINKVTLVPADNGMGYFVFFKEDNLLDKNGKPYILSFDKLNTSKQIKDPGFGQKLRQFLGTGAR